MTMSISFNSNSLQGIQTTKGVELELVGKAAPPAAKEVLSPQALKARCLETIATTRSNFQDLSNGLWSTLRQQSGAINDKIEKFQERYQEKIDILSKKDWKSLKKEFGDRMATDKSMHKDGVSFEEFRTEAQKFQEELTGMALKELGVPPIKTKDGGTPGYNSDKDVTILTDPKASEVDKMLTKTLADTSYTHTFRGLSGTQIDLETYLLHPGVALKTDSVISDLDSKRMFSRLETTMAALDMRRSFGPDEKGWKNYTNDFLTKTSHMPEFNQAMEKIFAEVESFESAMISDIKMQILAENCTTEQLSVIKEGGKEAVDKAVSEILKDNPEALKNASMLYKSSRLMNLSADMDKDAQALAGKKQAIENLTGQLITLKNRQKNMPSGYNLGADKLQKECKALQLACEKLEINIATRAAIRNSFFDESYLTQGALNKVVESEGGQFALRRDEGIMDQITRNRAVTHVSQFTVVSKKTFKEATPQEQVMSAMENFSKYTNKQEKYSHEASKAKTAKEADHTMQHLVIEGAKYAERVTSSCVASLKQMAAKNPNLNPLLKQAEALHQKTSELEKCKRKFVLNKESSIELLTKALLAPNATRSAEDKMKKDLLEVMQHFEPRGKFDGEELSSADKYNLAMGALEQKGLIKVSVKNEDAIKQGGSLKGKSQEVLFTSSFATVDAIMQARSGFSRLTDSSINALHKEAEEITLDKLGLTSKSQVEAYNAQIKTTVTLLMSNAVNDKFIAAPTINVGEMTLNKIWQCTNPDPVDL